MKSITLHITALGKHHISVYNIAQSVFKQHPDGGVNGSTRALHLKHDKFI